MHESQTPGTVNCRINMGLLCTLCTPSSLEKAVLFLGPRPEREAVDAIVGQCQNVVSGCSPLRIIRYLSDHCNSHNAKCCREITARTWQVLAWGRLMWRGEDAAPTSTPRLFTCVPCPGVSWGSSASSSFSRQRREARSIRIDWVRCRARRAF